MHPKVRTNADTRATPARGRLGAEGIGLCRTEHMFFEADRVKAMREMILSDTPEQRRAALAEILPFQQKDLRRCKALEGRPMTVRFWIRRCMSSCRRKAWSKKSLPSPGIGRIQPDHRAESVHEFNP